MRIAFLMDKLESINPENETTSYLMYECNQRGHTVYFLESHDIYIRKDEVVARMRNITVQPDLSMKKYWRSLISCMNKEELIFETLTDIDALFLRKDPPLIYQTMEFLAPINDQVFMINSTTGQVLANSKLYILNFPGIIPETHVSRDPARLKKIVEEYNIKRIILFGPGKITQKIINEEYPEVKVCRVEDLQTLEETIEEIKYPGKKSNEPSEGKPTS